MKPTTGFYPGDDEDVRLPDYMGNALTNYNCKFILPDKFGYRLMGIGDFDIHPDCYSDLNGSIQINIKNAILKEDNDPKSYRYHMIQELFEGKPEKYEKELIGIMQVFQLLLLRLYPKKPSITRGVTAALLLLQM